MANIPSSLSSGMTYRRRSVSWLTKETGVYVLCDLDQIPVYVGQSKDGIQNRVRRHLTSARSDVIANRQIDVWEIAYVWAFPAHKDDCDRLEAFLYHHFNDQKALMNGAAPKRPSVHIGQAPEPEQIIQVIPDHEIAIRLNPAVRAPRQIAHYQMLLDYFLNVKNSKNVAFTLAAHFDRLREFHAAIMSVLPFDDED